MRPPQDLISLLAGMSIYGTLIYNNNRRLYAIVIIRALQAVLFFTLARKQDRIRELKIKSTAIVTLSVLTVFACLFFIFSNLSSIDARADNIFLAIGLLFMLIDSFVIFEIFVCDENSAVAQSMQIQHLEIETQHFRELNTIQADLRTWRHENNNNLVSLRAIIEHETSERALVFIDKIIGTARRDAAILQTGNTVLDAVVSSKFFYARSQGIEVSLHAVYPEQNFIEDNDLCAICGNLLDNAVEACERMGESEHTRFISFSLLTKGKNITLTIENSYNGEVRYDGTAFLTTKDNGCHGIGIRLVSSIIDKYQGLMLIEPGDGVFETRIILPVIP